MLRYLETRVDPVATPPGEGPPTGLIAFFWYFISQAKWLFAALFVVGIAAALVETAIPYFIGRLVAILTSTPREELFATAWPTFATMLFVVLVARPAILFVQRAISNHGISGPLNTLTRWQSHHHVIRQSLGFFQNDFAGRIANHVMQAGGGVRETALATMRSVLHILFYGVAATGLMLAQDWRLALPILVWVVLYVTLLTAMVPKLRDRSREASAKRSAVTGKVVDGYTNIQTVKLFARTADEDRYIRDAMLEMNTAFLAQHRVNTLHRAAEPAQCRAARGGRHARRGAVAGRPRRDRRGRHGAAAHHPAHQHVRLGGGGDPGHLRECRRGAGEHGLHRPPHHHARCGGGAPAGGHRRRHHLRSRHLRLWPQGPAGHRHLSLTIRPGEKVGLVGRSGAGKSTLVNLMLRFHDVEEGAIRIDGQDVREVTQESLRQAVSVVTQDTSLLHRSIRDNILYGRPDANEADLEAAARQAHADSFIPGLRDSAGRTGYDAHVGERGVKLSGGQRQRIAIARVILKDAPILVLDEATAALDSEVEAAIQESLGDLMEGKTVLAIAHRLSTLKIMDRLVVIDGGRIVEEGSHDALIARRGLYAQLWARQSGGFLADLTEAAE